MSFSYLVPIEKLVIAFTTTLSNIKHESVNDKIKYLRFITSKELCCKLQEDHAIWTMVTIVTYEFIPSELGTNLEIKQTRADKNYY